LISVVEGIDSGTEGGEFTIKLLSVIAEQERKQISRRTKSGKRAAAKNGSYLPGRAPFGYTFNKETKTIETNEEQKKVYLEMVDLYTIDHLSTPKVADVLTERRYHTPGSSNGGKRSPSTIWISDMVIRILKNTVYYGEATYFTQKYETVICKETGMPYHKRTKDKSGEEGIVVKFPQMVSKTKWDEIQAQIKYNRKRPRTNRRKHATNTFLVSDTLGRQFRCGLCGSKIAAKIRKRYRSGRVFYQYMCAKHYQSRKQLEAKGYKKCPLPSVDSGDADFEVWKEISFLISNPIKFLRTWLPKEEFGSTDNLVATLRSKLRNKQAGLDRMTDIIATTEDDSIAQSCIKKQHQLSKEMVSIEAKIETSKREQNTSAEAIEYLRKLVKETEEVITQVGKEAEAGGDTDGLLIPSIYNTLEAITDFDIRQRILSSVVAPENGGYVELTYNFDENEGAIGHDVKVNAMLNTKRVANIIKEIRNEGGLNNTFKLSNSRKGPG
ncbi:MAG: recombinase family protein, partial [Deltaproteobacteria bacterium]|nr:recombinase family protein [Deltaproteobacteria bacterium]